MKRWTVLLMSLAAVFCLASCGAEPEEPTPPEEPETAAGEPAEPQEKETAPEPEEASQEEPKGEAESKESGSEITWTVDDTGTLILSGTGPMEDYKASNNFEETSLEVAPWESEKDKITSIIIEPGITSIGSFAFSDCYMAEEICIPDGVRSIGEGAVDCPLLSLTLPDSVSSIGSGAFWGGCFYEVTIPDGVTVIREGTFGNVADLKRITIPKSVTSIEHAAFGMTSLTDIYYEGTKRQWDEIEIGEENDSIFTAVIHDTISE